MAEVVDVIKNETENIMQSIIVANPTKKIVYDDGTNLYLIETDPYYAKENEVYATHIMPCIISYDDDDNGWKFAQDIATDLEATRVRRFFIGNREYIYNNDLHAYVYEEHEEP